MVRATGCLLTTILLLSTTLFTNVLFSHYAFAENLSEQKYSQSEQSFSSLTIEKRLAALSQEADKKRVASQLQQLINIPKLTPLQRYNILYAQEVNYLHLGDFNQAITAGKLAREVTLLHGFRQKQADTEKMLGVIYYYKSMFPQALSAYQSSFDFYKNQDAPVKQANLLNNIALVQTGQGDFTDAIESYQLAETLYQEYGSETDKVDVRYNIAVLYISLRRFDIAIKMLLDVISKKEALGQQDDQAKAWGDLGVAYKYSGQLTLAKQYALEAKQYFEINNQQYELSAQLHNLAEVYNQLGEIALAEKYAKQGVVLSKKIDHKKAYVGSLQTLALVLFRQGHLAEALKNLRLSQKLAIEMDYQDMQYINKAFFSLIYAAQGNAEDSLVNFQQYLNESYRNSNKLLNKQLALFESEQLNQKLSQLQQQKKLQKLQIEQTNLQQMFIGIAAFLLIVVGFFVYRKNVEKQSKLALATKVKQRTQALENTTTALQAANQIKSQFLANMSHEIRTPLTAVIGQAEAILAGDIEQADLNKEVAIILDNSHHLLRLINDILDLSKIEANKLELVSHPEDIHVILRDVHNMFAEQAARKHLAFEVIDTLETPFVIDADGLRIKQILINLCSNAIKFTFKGKVSLQVTSVENELIFTVSDTGIGMSPAQLKQVFDSFTQGDASISRKYGGSGLGLFLSSQLAHLMLGKITVESREDEGSVFTFTLPYFLSTVDVSASHNEDIKNEFEALSSIKDSPKSLLLSRDSQNRELSNNSRIEQQLTQKSLVAAINTKFSGQILLAEDHDDNRRLIARLLTGLGLDVCTASNGREAIELFLKTKVNVILLDIQMPEMDGIEAYKKAERVRLR